MEKIEIGKAYTRDELEEQGMREVGELWNQLVFSNGSARRLLWDLSSHKVVLVFNDDKRYATH